MNYCIFPMDIPFLRRAEDDPEIFTYGWDLLLAIQNAHCPNLSIHLIISMSLITDVDAEMKSY
jgi:hypothetical protein